ncbi:MAG: hypothetical protein U9R66_12595 [Thermodesulfobacteriota bacterium]|nr:hypothetical protein [Thermodesulfobacteriota bacterium]
MNKHFVIPMAFFFVFMGSQVTIAAPLNLSKSDGISKDECVISEENLTYTICYDNLPNSYEVHNVIITDKLPAKASFVSADNGGEYKSFSHSVTWDIGSLAENAIRKCVQLTINVTALPGTVLTNQVTIDSSELISTVEKESTDICPVSVYLDIKPGGCPTPINVGSKGVLPVAVLGTNDFDVTTIDPQSISLAGVSPLRWEMEDVATPYAINVDECNIDDCHELTSDGYVDLTLKFDSQEIYAAIGEVYDRKCLILELTGNLTSAHDKLPIKGGDVVSILKKGRKHNIPATNCILLK